MSERQEHAPSVPQRGFLDAIERLGNKLPDPIMIFVYLIVFLMVLSQIGAWLGWQVLPLTILLSSLVGAVVGVALIAFARHGRNVPIPFGPYLAAAGLIALFWGERITERYLGLL